MILSDTSIRELLTSGEIGLETLPEYDVFEQIGPTSLDFRLGKYFKLYKRDRLRIIHPGEPIPTEAVEMIEIPEGGEFILHPGQFVLGATIEKIKVPYNLVARCEGRSSLGRLGIIIHSTAGFIDPGFEGTITLEITNINEVPIALKPGMRIGQLAFETVHGTVENTYDKRRGSKYMHQVLPEESRIIKDLY
ncbi:MAG: dCTP deaminase [Candidatus Gracilibacteria bacterium]|nr:dCTP deaminase [Candidatus Gracilibacteria bacterium]